jgi:hypothetical protein
LGRRLPRHAPATKHIYYVRLDGGDSPARHQPDLHHPTRPAEAQHAMPMAPSLSAAFCQEGRVLTYLEASGSGYAGPSDPRFAEFIRNVTFKLFPPNNPNNPNFRSGQPDHCHRHLSC